MKKIIYQYFNITTVKKGKKKETIKKQISRKDFLSFFYLEGIEGKQEERKIKEEMKKGLKRIQKDSLQMDLIFTKNYLYPVIIEIIATEKGN